MRETGSNDIDEAMAGHSNYVGRFAPSPSGPLHLGSMLAALASYLDAKAAGGQWLVRIDDIDTPRNVDGAEEAILRTLEAHGLNWDGALTRQSERLDQYEAALAELAQKGLLFWCSCSRKSLRGNIYPGKCRQHTSHREDCAIRLRTPPGEVRWQERSGEARSENVEKTVGDYVLKRRDGLFSYQLCVVVDDADSGINHIVRGDDLRITTGRQIQLTRLLGYPEATYLHIPTINSRSGHKLSKQTFAPGVDTQNPNQTLTTLMQLLGLETPTNALHLSIEELLRIAIEQWRLLATDGRYQPTAIENFVGF